MKSQVNLQRKTRQHFIVNGLALFSMFFGAGNVIFPLIIGQALAINIPFALLGLFFTAILVPFSGVISTALFEGDYYSFFKRTGNFSGYFIILILFALIGPFGGIPRLIGLSYSSVKVYLPNLKLLTFSAVACACLFIFTLKKNKIIDVLGYVLTPLLIGSLTFIIIKGVLTGSDGESGRRLEAWQAFFYGIKEGYNTMDLLASFFFASLLYKRVKHDETSRTNRSKAMLVSMLKSSAIGAFLLSLVYLGFTYVSAFHTKTLSEVPSDQLLGKIGHLVLGQHAGFIVCLVIVLSCLTTAIALTVLCADFMREQFQKTTKKPPHWLCLFSILVTALVVSTLEFKGIITALAPILEVIYPALLVLCFFNILHKIYGIKAVKLPFYTVFSVMVINSFINLLK